MPPDGLQPTLLGSGYTPLHQIYGAGSWLSHQIPWRSWRCCQHNPPPPRICTHKKVWMRPSLCGVGIQYLGVALSYHFPTQACSWGDKYIPGENLGQSGIPNGGVVRFMCCVSKVHHRLPIHPSRWKQLLGRPPALSPDSRRNKISNPPSQMPYCA